MATSIETVPRLYNGDRMTRIEFERRYEAMPHIKKAELIEGIVYMGSPVTLKHAEPHSMVITWLGVYVAGTPYVDYADNATVRLDIDNEPQPDALLRIVPEAGGQARVSNDHYLEGPPELVVEIAYSSVAYDLHSKLNIYRRSSVQEYLVWQTFEHQFTWFVLEDGEYLTLDPDTQGNIRSQVFPGLYLNVPALLSGNLAEVLSILQKGINTQDHTQFVQTLTQRVDAK